MKLSLNKFVNLLISRHLSHSQKKCVIWCDKGYTEKNKKQVGCYVNLDGVETFSNIWDH